MVHRSAIPSVGYTVSTDLSVRLTDPMTAEKLIPNYTVDDYATWQGDWELWDGIPVSKAPRPFGPHSAAVVQIIASLVVQLRDCHARVLTELDWIVDQNNVIRPDVVVVCFLLFPDSLPNTIDRLHHQDQLHVAESSTEVTRCRRVGDAFGSIVSSIRCCSSAITLPWLHADAPGTAGRFIQVIATADDQLDLLKSVSLASSKIKSAISTSW